jgi:hypothetical protein
MPEHLTDVELRNPDDLIPYANNAKEHPDEQVNKIASSIKNYGWDQPIVVDDDSEIIKGHGRLQAAKKLDLDEVPVIERTDLSDAEAKAARIADNKTAESAWDDELLEVEVEELNTEFDMGALELGFDDDELNDLLDAVDDNDSDTEYTDKIETPTYEPTQDEPPALSECYDTDRYNELISAIEQADVSGEFEEFLRFAAQRHIVFDYENIAEYFAHQDAETQELMELLTLVIVDYDQAVEEGFVTFAKNVREEMPNA